MNELFYIYDNTFEGLLTCVFHAFNRREMPSDIVPEQTQLPLFSESYIVITEDEKADRVLESLKKKISASAVNMLFVCSLSELPRIPFTIFNYIRKTFQSDRSIEMNFADPDVLELSKVYKKVRGEYHRMQQFVRFQKTADGIYFALMEPRYNVLPMSSEHFKDRYADQPWIVYDVVRKYGIYYDLEKTGIVHFDNPDISLKNTGLSAEQMDEKEVAFQGLWKEYIQSVTIRERKNLKLQRQHMPKRFWKYLTEKQ